MWDHSESITQITRRTGTRTRTASFLRAGVSLRLKIMNQREIYFMQLFPFGALVCHYLKFLYFIVKTNFLEAKFSIQRKTQLLQIWNLFFQNKLSFFTHHLTWVITVSVNFIVKENFQKRNNIFQCKLGFRGVAWSCCWGR